MKMQIESIELSWFRGSGEAVLLNSQGKSVVIYGTNGAGKSSFADAFEYIVKNGKIGHLSHEYSGSHQLFGVRNTHAPESVASKLQVNFQEGKSLTFTIQPDGTFGAQCIPLNLLSEIQSWNLESLILRQDKVADFIHATKGEKYSVLLPLLGLEGLEQSATNLKSIQKALIDRGKIEQKKQRLTDLKQSALSVLPDLNQETLYEVINSLSDSYLGYDHQDDFNIKVEEILKAIKVRIDAAEPEQRRYIALKQIQQEQLREKLIMLEEAEKISSTITSETIDRQISVLEPTQEFLLSIATGIEWVECPACGRGIIVDQFNAHVREELIELSRAREARNNVIKARKNFYNSWIELEKNIEVILNYWGDLQKYIEPKEIFNRVISLNISQCDQRWSDRTWEVLQQDIPIVCEVINKVLEQVPPSTQQLLHDFQIISALGKVTEIQNLISVINKVDKIIECLERSEKAIRDSIISRTKYIMSHVSIEVQRLWTKLHPDEPIEKVELYIPGDADKAIDISLKFFGVDQPSPRLTLSEGHRNSLGLCIFMALVNLEKDRNHPIILVVCQT
jgi:AAA15 family ATPase/GTPase